MQINIMKIKIKTRETGQAMIIIVFAIIGIIGAAALAIDGTNAFIDSRRAETAASAAALTGALTRIEGGNWRAAALAAAAANGYDNNGVTNTVELNTPPLGGPYAGNSEYIEVVLTSHLRTYFGVVVGIPTITSVAHVISQSKPSEMGPMFPGYALVSLAPESQCEHHRAFSIHSEATINLYGGGIFVNSDNPDCALMSYGSGSIRIRDENRITVVGGASIQKPQLITPFPVEEGKAPIPYPPPYKLPQVGCGSKTATPDFESETISSGNYEDGVFPPEGIKYLESGIYCLQDDFIIKEGQFLEGKNVMFVMEDGDVLFSGYAEYDLSAPKTGRGAGLLIYMPSGNWGSINLNGSDYSKLRGTILALHGTLRINGLDAIKGAAYHSQMIAYNIEVNSTDNIEIQYEDEDNWDTLTMPEVILIK